ncbi:hypothetical protein FISHEDRAFT_62056 [Fistulina hepatica ATCC 64428]|nr:hypothetical protein FISHEDRAFT_62056 [Fistulina hepatica ATCC 64428]
MDNSQNTITDAPAIDVVPHISAQIIHEQPGDAPSTSHMKRRPGRPKGSTKKTADDVPKLKRPVGRPRKDGLPSGSVMSRPFKMKQTPIVAQASLKQILQIDPSLQSQDPWLHLASTDSDAYFRDLVAAMNAIAKSATQMSGEGEAFRLHLEYLSTKAPQSEMPALYTMLKTFWLPTSPPYFSLVASSSIVRTPSNHRFFYWDPLPLLFNGLSCPDCTSPLFSKGRIESGPIKIFDLSKPFYIIGCEYVCQSQACCSRTSHEGRRFASTDAAIIRALPQALREEFPARILPEDIISGVGPKIWCWRAVGVSHSLWNMTQAFLRVGMGREDIIRVLTMTWFGVPAQDALSLPAHEHADPNASASVSAAAGPSLTADEDAEFSADVEASTGDNDQDTGCNLSNGSAWPTSVPPPQPSTEPSTSTSTPPVLSSLPPPPPPPPTEGPLAPPPQSQTFAFVAAPDYTTYYPNYPGYSVIPPPMPTLPPVAGAVPAVELPQMSPPGSAGSLNSLKRAYPFTNDGVYRRAPRHCLKCGRNDCKGKGGRAFCHNVCQDCGKSDCKGRNGKRRDKPCNIGWD